MSLNAKDVFNKISDSINSKFLLTKEGEHRLSKGEKREDIVKSFLRENLPESYGIGEGEIFDTAGNLSKECDIIIYNTAVPAFKSPQLNLFPIDGVFGVCQVKTDLDKPRLKDAIENIQSVKRMRLKSPSAFFGKFRDRAYCSIFAFDGNYTIRENIIEIYKELNVPKEEQIDLICILNKFFGISYPREQGFTFSLSNGRDLSDEQILFFDTKKDTLSFFIPIIEVCTIPF